VDKKRVRAFPLAFYAAQHLVEHAQYEDVASRVQNAMEELFNPTKSYFSAWVWIHDVEKDRNRRSINDLTQHPSPPMGTALYYAALCGFSGVANYLIITHAEDINAKSGSWGAPLHAALRFRHDEVVYLLLRHNVDVNSICPMNAKWAPLHFASSNGRAKVVQLLLGHGADINALSDLHNSPLHLASRDGHPEIVRVLLMHGADVHIRNHNDRIPLQEANVEGRVEVAQLLSEYSAENE